MLFFPWGWLDSWSTHRTHWLEARGCLDSHSIPVFFFFYLHRGTKTRTQPYVKPLGRHGTQERGADRPLLAELDGSGVIHPSHRASTPWLSSTMCSSDSCSSEILGLGKHVCYADSRTTNFTRLTSPPSVRTCTQDFFKTNSFVLLHGLESFLLMAFVHPIPFVLITLCRTSW